PAPVPCSCHCWLRGFVLMLWKDNRAQMCSVSLVWLENTVTCTLPRQQQRPWTFKVSWGVTSPRMFSCSWPLKAF
uniref:Uncharacterized protein n=1 Tax=Zosterops lateralis melanops TaxID=1220523 RepID=A0A8D2NPP1_ZOSLA